MASSIFGQKKNGNSVLNLANNPSGFDLSKVSRSSLNNLAAKMYQSNPNFRQFANSMQGKTPEQAFRENGLNFNQFKNIH